VKTEELVVTETEKSPQELLAEARQRVSEMSRTVMAVLAYGGLGGGEIAPARGQHRLSQAVKQQPTEVI